ncbi:DNA polymerase III delta subunit [Salisediminibacterium halotolerans]|nr:DNA polymerase III delta subunit [Actinophytocola xinjiangensis]RPE88488.1 DNA polymerase III delta subunit [Salisediminibacterium halotolerans]TWG37150.1 DNA polymerase III delta subunit [Salisediminibacterium halotolerans]
MNSCDKLRSSMNKEVTTVSYIDVLKHIQNQETAPIYLLFGTESYLIEDAVGRIVNKALTKDEQEFNLSTFDMNETPVDAAVEEAYTFPFMGGKRVVILKNAHFLTAQKNSAAVEHDTEKLRTYAENPVTESTVIIQAPYEKLDERKKLVKQIKQQAVVMDGKPLNENELRSWLKSKGEENGVTFAQGADDLLLQLTGGDLMVLASEVYKLSLYAGEEGIIQQDAVEALTARSLDQDIFALVDGVVKGQTEQAVSIYYDLIKQKEAPLKILALMVRQFRILYQVKQMAEQGYGEKMIAGRLKLHPYVVKLAQRQTGRFSDSQLMKKIDELAELDFRIKTGRVSDELGVELFLYESKNH